MLSLQWHKHRLDEKVPLADLNVFCPYGKELQYKPFPKENSKEGFTTGGEIARQPKPVDALMQWNCWGSHYNEPHGEVVVMAPQDLHFHPILHMTTLYLKAE